MPNQDQFTQELELFRNEVESAARFLFARLAVDEQARKDPAAVETLNQSPYFWHTVLQALFEACVISLGRIYDNRSAHNISVLLRCAVENSGTFSKDALAARKREGSANADEWLDTFLAGVHDFNPGDFRDIATKVKKFRKAYEDRYKDLRDKVVAHAELDLEARPAFYQKIETAELQQMLVFLVQVHQALWELLMNGKEPVIAVEPWGIEEIVNKTRLGSFSGPSYPQVLHEVSALFGILLSRHANYREFPDAVTE
jgi:hypothetical protein